MNSHTTVTFRKMLTTLPAHIRQQARKAYTLFQRDPSHPSLFFKRVPETKQIYSVRITKGYRAVGVKKHEKIIWFWIGTHDEYERLLQQL